MHPPRDLETAQLRLRPVTLADAADIFQQYAGRELPTRFMPFTRHLTLAESEGFARRCVECWTNGSAFAWAITTKESDALIGVIELRLSPPKADFGYILGDDWWGRGFTTEAASVVVDWAMAQSAIFRVWATCHPDNLASAAVLKSAGLSFETTLANWESRPQLKELAGDSHCYALTRPVD